MTSRIVFAFAVAAAGISYCYFRGVRAKSVKGEVKEDLHRWEGEGGNDPAVATPTPAVAPQSSYPADSSSVRH